MSGVCPPPPNSGFAGVNFLVSCVMSQAQSLWSDFPPCPLPQHIPSLLYRSHSDEQAGVNYVRCGCVVWVCCVV